MQFSILTIFALAALTVSANPYDGLYDLSPRDLENHIIAREAYIETFDKYRRNMIERRLALPKGGGGGGKGGGKPKTPPKDKNNNNSNGGGIQPCPPGFSADGKKAWDACQKASNAPGDCNDMIGPFAAAGCSQAKASIMKPCENKEVQGYLRKEACKKDPTWKYCK